MHYQREYEYPLYKRTNSEEMQIIPKGVFGNKQNYIFPQKLVRSPIEYHQSTPIEYNQPMYTHHLNIRAPYPNQQFSSQSNICAGSSNALSCSKTSTDDFPLWLKIYSRASIECDHKLHWDMFNVRDLYFFDNVLVKLYELDLEEIILWYKCYKNALLREMDKRLLKANQQRQMILFYNS